MPSWHLTVALFCRWREAGVESQYIPADRAVYCMEHGGQKIWFENCSSKIKVAVLSFDFGQNIPLFSYRLREQFVQDFLSKAIKRKDPTVLTVGFPCQFLNHLWLELAVWFTHDLQLPSAPPNPPWHTAPTTTSSPVRSSAKNTHKRRPVQVQ